MTIDSLGVKRVTKVEMESMLSGKSIIPARARKVKLRSEARLSVRSPRSWPLVGLFTARRTSVRTSPVKAQIALSVRRATLHKNIVIPIITLVSAATPMGRQVNTATSVSGTATR